MTLTELCEDNLVLCRGGQAVWEDGGYSKAMVLNNFWCTSLVTLYSNSYLKRFGNPLSKLAILYVHDKQKIAQELAQWCPKLNPALLLALLIHYFQYTISFNSTLLKPLDLLSSESTSAATMYAMQALILESDK